MIQSGERLPHSIRRSLMLIASLTAAPLAAQSAADTRARECPSCAEWSAGQQPFRIWGNTYYVGTHGLAAILVTSPAGDVLIDGALPESADSIIAHVRQLGFRIEDVKLILNSHAHYDHAGGIAALERASGASVAASPWSARVLEQGKSLEGDPQLGIALGFPPVRSVRVLADGDTMHVGPLSIVARFTPGHTPGGTTWTWRSCERGACYDMVYADSQTPVSADGFLFSRSAAVDEFHRSYAVLNSLPCDILLTPHPGASQLFERVASRKLVDRKACRALAATSARQLDERLAKERGGE
jgi:metallo-beta-lactamase class B